VSFRHVERCILKDRVFVIFLRLGGPEKERCASPGNRSSIIWSLKLPEMSHPTLERERVFYCKCRQFIVDAVQPP